MYMLVAVLSRKMNYTGARLILLVVGGSLMAILGLWLSVVRAQEITHHERQWQELSVAGVEMMAQNDWGKALTSYQAALSEAVTLGDHNIRKAVSLIDVGRVLEHLRSNAKAEQSYLEALECLKFLSSRAWGDQEFIRKIVQEETILATCGLAGALAAQGESTKAEARYRQCIKLCAMAKELSGTALPDATVRQCERRAISGLIGILRKNGKHQDLLRLKHELSGSEHAALLIATVVPAILSAQDKAFASLVREAEAFARMRDFRSAVQLYEKAEKLKSGSSLRSDPDLVECHLSIARMYKYMHQSEKSQRRYEQFLAECGDSNQSWNPMTAYVITALIDVLEGQGKLAEALPWCERLEKMQESIFGSNSLALLYVISRRGHYLYRLGRLDEAEPFLRRAVSMRDAQGGSAARSMESAGTLMELSHIMSRKNQMEKAYSLADRAYSIYKDCGAQSRPAGVQTARTMARMCVRMQRPDQAEKICLNAISERGDTYFPGDPANGIYVWLYGDLLSVLLGQDRYVDAVSVAKQAVAVASKTLPADAPEQVYAREWLVNVYLSKPDWARAEPVARDLLKAAQRTGIHREQAGLVLGRICTYQAKYHEAEPLLVGAIEALEHQVNREPSARQNLDSALATYARLLRLTGRREESSAMMRKRLVP